MDNTELKNQSDSLSYAIGISIGESLKQDNLESLNTDILVSAMRSTLAKDSMKMSMQTAQQTIQQFMMIAEKKKGEKNLADGQKFLEENKKKPGVVTLPSGLQYMIMKQGDGPKPAATDKVKTNYHGTLIDGKVFDSSVERGEPATFAVNQVIPGWTEALQLMPVGSKWKLFVPANLAYGERGAGKTIGPNTALVFEVELLSIEK